MSQNNPLPGGEVALFEAPDGQIRLDVRLEQDTVWLTQAQMAELFGRERSVITKHINNVFKEGELDRDSVCANFAHTAEDGKTYSVQHFNLDIVISVGYRVKSLRGTQFRIWATRTLRDHLVQGYTLNERRLREKGLTEMEQAVHLLARTLSSHELVNDQGRAVLNVVARYARSWRLLLQYDENSLPESPAHPTRPVAGLPPDESRRAIAGLKQALLAKDEATALFGQERGGALDGVLGSIEQTFGGEALYPSVETRAAHLLYFIIKDHPFSDGNKRIGSFLFLLYLDRNGLLTKPDGAPAVRRQRAGRRRLAGHRERPRAQRTVDPVDPEFASGGWRMTAESDEVPNWHLKFKVTNCDLEAGDKGGRNLRLQVRPAYAVSPEPSEKRPIGFGPWDDK